tara:strand:- start:7305 stop:8219 length:915 start_codon:yes stop_codon:yes gene_type:complete
MENELKINNSKTVLITGAGSGMGLATAKILIKNGFKVWAGIRDPESRNIKKSNILRDYAKRLNKEVQIVDLDIHFEQSCENAMSHIISKDKKIDILIHNAAHLFIGFAEQFTPEQYASSLNKNFLGVHRLNRAAIPHMRNERNGLILYVGSGITAITAPFMAPYVIGKTAMDQLAENTSYEINRFGIESSILMPGVFMEGTSHFDTAEFPKDKSLDESYLELKADFDNYEKGLRNLFRQEDAPIEGVAEKILEIIQLPKGTRPLRPTIDYSDYGAEAVNAVREAMTKRVFDIMEYSHLQKVCTI